MADPNIQESISLQQTCWSCKKVNDLTNPNVVFGLLGVDDLPKQGYFNCLFCQEKNLVEMAVIVEVVEESIRLDESVKGTYGLVESDEARCPHCGQPYSEENQ